MYKRFASAFLVLLLSGCATKMLKPDPITQADLTAQSGVLAGSFARNPNAPQYYSQTFYFKNAVTGEKHEIKSQQEFNPLSGGRTADEFKKKDGAGATFALKLPVGRYVFYNFSLYRPSPLGHTYYYSKADFAIPFEVVPNQVSYVGEIKLEGSTGRNIFGMKMPAGGIWIISDKKDRDLALLQTAMPGLPLTSVASVVPMTKDVFTPLVVLPSEPQPAQPKQDEDEEEDEEEEKK